MSITSSGLLCDVCGRHILPFVNEEYEVFGIKGVNNGRDMHCHPECKDVLAQANDANDWKMLPDGPLRRGFAKCAASIEARP